MERDPNVCVCVCVQVHHIQGPRVSGRLYPSHTCSSDLERQHYSEWVPSERELINTSQ